MTVRDHARQKPAQRAVLLALGVGRRCGLRAAYEALDRLADELAWTRKELERLQQRYLMAREIIRRTDEITAWRERRDDGVTLH